MKIQSAPPTSRAIVKKSRPEREPSIESVSDIVGDSTIPLISPFALKRAAEDFTRRNPAKIGRLDQLVLETGKDGATRILRNDEVEFKSDSCQGSHDADHISFESCWEQLGGQPLKAASPLNEILVNSFEWVLEPNYQRDRIAEMNARRRTPFETKPTDKEFHDYLLLNLVDEGARQLVYQTALSNPLAQAMFQLVGRDPASFPNSTEMDWTLRLVSGSLRSTDSVKELFRDFSSHGIQVARIVNKHQPDYINWALNEAKKAESLRLEQGANQVGTRELELSPGLLQETEPHIKAMNKIVNDLAPVYRQGLQV